MLRKKDETMKLFDEWALSYDGDLKRANGPLFGYESSLHSAKQMTSSFANEIILDIGIGTGAFASMIAHAKANVYGIDISQKMLEECKQKHPEYELKQGTFLDNDFSDCFFDHVISSFAFHEVFPQQREEAIRNIYRMMKTDGQLLILDIMFASEAAREDAKVEIGKYWDNSEDYPIVNELDTMLRKVGFKNIIWQQTAPCHWAFRAIKKTR
ncbi:class I SAM-dependent methyltransferase [Bacillus shivajii]|uniref:class I SAM-dependent methyltransferase n=1 Tax=Bacillus shivajii TaxID=1983719 RepID=UPI001CFC1204|nr:class I SAM-dependent methyltransferase [Bacillus shivajii]UCZ52584.1 class I SAM-dependent methyltransferase [Bacillus shivajii]